jgi:hypothetical protein
MKKKIMILVIAGILIVGNISVAYAAGRNVKSLNNFNIQMMSTQNSDAKSSYNYSGTMMDTQNGGIRSIDSFNNMIEIMKDNGFNDEAYAMENRDFDSMNELMTNLSDADYKKMIDIMQKNGYGYMANMMQSVSREGMTNIHQGMMGRY